METPNILKKQDVYIIEYPEAVKFADTQNSVFWTADEIDVSKDVQDIMTGMTDAERYATIEVLKLFTQYELAIGNEYWGERVKQDFQRPDIQRMANSFSYFEINVHAPFYNKLNEALHLNTHGFLNEYKQDPVLSSRMTFIDEQLNSPDILHSLGVFSMVEGAILYSNFAFLKHFQSQGKNKMLNVVRGINFSVRDENLHNEGGAWLFRTLLKESNLSDYETDKLFENIRDAAKHIREHEHRIIAKMFTKGPIDGITQIQMNNFIDSRINLCLKKIGIDKLFDVTYNPIAEWFYKGINSYTFHDFFTGTGNQYNRKWDESKLGWTN